MKAAAVAIGVDKTGGLTPLGGAAAGAVRFGEWAKRQGMDVWTLTDAGGGKVRVNDILDVIEPIVNARTYGKLVVFFSGHGYLQSQQTELWLLSDAPTRGGEAINVRQSRYNARYCGIPHVIFVSDACRSGGANHTHRAVTGTPVFPVPADWDVDGEVDTFYGTRPGDPAYEFQDDTEAVANHKGVFTDCLLEALEGRRPEVVEEEADNGNVRWLVLSRPLKGHLREAVPDRAAEISIKLQQTPEVRVESDFPNFFAELSHAPSVSRSVFRSARASTEPRVDVRRIVERAEREAMSQDNDATIRTDTSTAAGRRFTEQVTTLAAARGRRSFETACGFTVNDELRSVTIGNDLGAETFQEDGLTHVRIHGARDRIGTSILLELENGAGSVIAVKPEFIGTIVVEDGQVVNVNYTPSESSSLYEEVHDSADRERIERRRAFAAAATRNGVFEVTGPDAADAAGYLRMLKRSDPTLGIYAAYAYSDVGRVRDVRDVLRYMRDSDPPPVPFDVALLAREPDWPPVAPFCPMLRQGWALLELHPPSVAVLSELRTMLLPGLWTMFTPEGVARVRTALENGDLK